MNELREFVLSKNKPISSCKDLYKHFIGRHKVIPVYLTPKFEMEFEYIMNKLEALEKENQKYKEVIEKVKDYINDVSIHTDNYFDLNNNLWIREVELLDILKEVEHE